MRIEQKILKSLLVDSDYATKVMPYLKKEYFTVPADHVIFDQISKFISKYSDLPTVDTLRIEINSLDGFNDDEVVKDIQTSLTDLETVDVVDNKKWILDSTEEFCQQKALYIAIHRSIEIMSGEDKNLDKGAIPGLLSDALAISFDPNVGHDYFEDWEERFDRYHQKTSKVPFDIDMLNKATQGGMRNKTLGLWVAPPGFGKTTMLCHQSAWYLSQGMNVLYISMEMDHDEISKKIDSNLFNIDSKSLMLIDKEHYEKKIGHLRSKSQGKLVIRQFPSSGANANHFKALLKELQLKKGFVPQVIVIDYLNICSSSTMKMGGSINSYTYMGKVSVELREIAIENDLIMWSACQFNREGAGSTDPSEMNLSDSFGIMFNADYIFALYDTEEMREMGQVIVKQIKNRYDDKNYPRNRFPIGFNRAKSKAYDIEEDNQEEIEEVVERANKAGPDWGD